MQIKNKRVKKPRKEIYKNLFPNGPPKLLPFLLVEFKNRLKKL